MVKLTDELLKTCTICKMKLPIESFDKYRYQCKECRRKSKKEKYKTNVINQGGSKNGIGEVKTASGTNIGLPDWSKDYSISMFPSTYEELLRKQICSIVTPVIVAIKSTLISLSSCIIWPRDYN